MRVEARRPLRLCLAPVPLACLPCACLPCVCLPGACTLGMLALRLSLLCPRARVQLKTEMMEPINRYVAPTVCLAHEGGLLAVLCERRLAVEPALRSAPSPPPPPPTPPAQKGGGGGRRPGTPPPPPPAPPAPPARTPASPGALKGPQGSFRPAHARQGGLRETGWLNPHTQGREFPPGLRDGAGSGRGCDTVRAGLDALQPQTRSSLGPGLGPDSL
jgi:hypothetical protein